MIRRVKRYWEESVLVVRAFYAIDKYNVALVKTSQEMKGQLKEECSKKPELEHCTLPHQSKIETSLMEEKDEIAFWSIKTAMCSLLV